jgi:hypothetical protein
VWHYLFEKKEEQKKSGIWILDKSRSGWKTETVNGSKSSVVVVLPPINK